MVTAKPREADNRFGGRGTARLVYRKEPEWHLAPLGLPAPPLPPAALPRPARPPFPPNLPPRRYSGSGARGWTFVLRSRFSSAYSP